MFSRGNVHSEYEKMTLYVDWWSDMIRIVAVLLRHSTNRSDFNFESLTHFAMSEDEQYRPRLRQLPKTSCFLSQVRQKAILYIANSYDLPRGRTAKNPVSSKRMKIKNQSRTPGKKTLYHQGTRTGTMSSLKKKVKTGPATTPIIRASVDVYHHA